MAALIQQIFIEYAYVAVTVQSATYGCCLELTVEVSLTISKLNKLCEKKQEGALGSHEVYAQAAGSAIFKL